jgi:hypothetical protein
VAPGKVSFRTLFFPVPLSIPSMLHIHSNISQVMDSEPIGRWFCPVTTMRENQVVISVPFTELSYFGLIFCPVERRSQAAVTVPLLPSICGWLL